MPAAQLCKPQDHQGGPKEDERCRLRNRTRRAHVRNLRRERIREVREDQGIKAAGIRSGNRQSQSAENCKFEGIRRGLVEIRAGNSYRKGKCATGHKRICDKGEELVVLKGCAGRTTPCPKRKVVQGDRRVVVAQTAAIHQSKRRFQAGLPYQRAGVESYREGCVEIVRRGARWPKK